MDSHQKRENGQNNRFDRMDYFRDESVGKGIRVELEQSEPEQEPVVFLEDRVRLKAMQDLEILDIPSPRSLQVLVELANRFLGSPVSIISLVTDDRQFFLSSSGLGEPWASCRETPLSHSFCQHVVKRNEPLVVSDAENHQLVKDNRAIDELGVKGYLGVPIVMRDGSVIGSFCAIDTAPRVWTADDLETLNKLVELAVEEIHDRKLSLRRQEILENRLSQAQKMQAIGQLVGGVAHDFNNVLGAIQVQTEVLEALHKDSIPKPLTNIRKTVSSAKSIVQQLLNWSRPSTGKKKPVSLTDIVIETIPLISTFATKFIEINFEPVEQNDVIDADSNQISQLLLNLCSNSAYALKNSGGKIDLQVTLENLDQETAEDLDLTAGQFVKLNVKDNGCGIPLELQSRIHDPYFTTKPIGEGTGLGLWTVFGIVRGHDGIILVESKENVGTNIEMYFPVSDKKPDTSIVETINSTVVKSKSELRVMVIDDEPIITEGMEHMFELSGYQASGFTNGLVALKTFADNPESFDLVVTDQVMPDITGNELIRELKTIRQDIPVILCSGFSKVFQRADSELSEADGYCEKPIEFGELVRLVETLCNA